MGMSFDEAAEALYAGPWASFTAERKRLASELRASGDKPGAATFGKLGRPSSSAWAVNQLWRRARSDWDALVAASVRLGRGDLSAVSDERSALGALLEKGLELLRAEGNAASEQTRSRLETNLRSIVTTGWGADGPGRLVEDRPPPGFDALAGMAALAGMEAAPARPAGLQLVPQPPPSSHPQPAPQSPGQPPKLSIAPPPAPSSPQPAAVEVPVANPEAELSEQGSSTDAPPAPPPAEDAEQRARELAAARAAATEAHAQLDRSSARIKDLEDTLAAARSLHTQLEARAARADLALADLG